MDATAAQQGPQGCYRSGGKRRSWTQLEEKVLLQAFVEIIAQGWKTQNGFRNGFLIQLENKMKAAIPGTDLRGEPMISSKYGTWKKTFKDIQEVLRASGFGWNATTKTVIAYPPSVWEDLIQAHPGLGYIREKPFPMYETWVEIFGRDTATGAGAMDFGRAAMQHQPPPPPVNPNSIGSNANDPPLYSNSDNANVNGGDNIADAEDQGEHSSATPTPTVTPGGTAHDNSGYSNGTTRNLKRKRYESNEDLAGAISGSWEKATAAMNKIAARMGQEMDAAENRKWLYDAIGQLPIAIDMPERLRASIEIAMNQRAMDVFIGLPDDAKVGLVHMALDGALKDFK